MKSLFLILLLIASVNTNVTAASLEAEPFVIPTLKDNTQESAEAALGMRTTWDERDGGVRLYASNTENSTEGSTADSERLDAIERRNEALEAHNKSLLAESEKTKQVQEVGLALVMTIIIIAILRAVINEVEQNAIDSIPK